MGPQFDAIPTVEAWQLSNPPSLALAPLKVSLEIFQRAGMQNLRAKSEKITGYLEALIRERLADTLQIVTPTEPARRGCQLSLRVIGERAAVSEASVRRALSDTQTETQSDSESESEYRNGFGCFT